MTIRSFELIVIVISSIAALTLVGAIFGCFGYGEPVEMQTVTVINDMEATQLKYVTHNVYNVESHRTYSDYAGAPEYTVVLYIIGDGWNRHTRTYTKINRIESVSQGRTLLPQIVDVR